MGLATARQSDAHQLRQQSLHCSRTSILELSADGPQTAELVIQRSQTVAKDVFIRVVGHCAVRILLF